MMPTYMEIKMKYLLFILLFSASLFVTGCTQQQVAKQENDFMNKYREGTVVVYFWDKNCRACQIQSTEINAAKESMEFPLIRVIPNDTTIAKYNLKAFPTTLIFYNGKIAKRFEGVAYRDQILTELEFLNKEASEI